MESNSEQPESVPANDTASSVPELDPVSNAQSSELKQVETESMKMSVPELAKSFERIIDEQKSPSTRTEKQSLVSLAKEKTSESNLKQDDQSALENKETEKLVSEVPVSKSEVAEGKVDSSRSTKKGNANKKQGQKHVEIVSPPPKPKEKKKKSVIDTNVRDPLEMVSPPSPVPQEKLPRIEHQPDPFPYRHYPSIHPVSNKLLAMKWALKERTKLKKKLASVKPTVDFTPPKPYKHLQNKSKKFEMERGICKLK
jgi:hypothetical protein